MKVLLTIFPAHLRALPALLIAAVAKGIVGDTLNILKGQSAINAQNAYIFMDLQANNQSTELSRNIAEIKIPGREGEVLQDMGGNSLEIPITGKWIFENKPNDMIEDLMSAVNLIPGINVGWNWARIHFMYMLARFNAPMILASNLFVGPVILKKFGAQESGGMPNVYNYSMLLKEFNPAMSLLGGAAFSGFEILSGATGATDGMIRGH